MTNEEIKELKKYEKDGLITIRTHDTLPLRILNYTSSVQYDRLWTPLLMQCRGLVIDDDWNIVARSMNKFFNYQEHMDVDSLPDIPNEPFEAYEKLDGSCGICFFYDGSWIISTRGSFHSEQADYANEVLLPKYDISNLDKSKTYLFEIIFNSNRIVVNYGDRKELVLLACIDTQSGNETDISEIEWPHKAEKYDFSSFNEILEKMEDFDDGNTEGFVIRFESGLRVKVKLEEYVRLHRLLTGLTKRTIWELLRDGSDIEKIYDTAPDEVYEWVDETVKEIQDDYNEIELASKLVFAGVYCRLSTMIELPPKHIDEDYDLKEYEAHKRKEFAKIVTSNENIKKEGLTPIMFRMYDGRSIDDLIWKSIKPAHRPLEAT